MKHLIVFVLFPALCGYAELSAQVAVNASGSAPDPRAMLDVSATDKGLLPPRLTDAQRDAIQPPIPAGLLIFNTTTNCANIYNGSSWVELCGTCVPAPTAAAAGPDQLDIAGASALLAANIPGSGNGTWTVISGTGGSFSSAASPSATFSGVAGSSYVLRWTITNSCGASSDDVNISFEQPFACGDQMADADGNLYPTVQVGTQCWMADNLRTTRYRNNDPIPLVTDNAAWDNLSSGGYCFYNNNPSNSPAYGAMYNWYAATDSRSICPDGWHLPSDPEWKTLEMHLGLSLGQADAFGSDRGSNIRVQLTTTSGWYNGANGNNSTGFSGQPGGWREGIYFSNLTQGGYWWTATAYNSTQSIFRMLYYFYGGIGREYDLGFDKKTGMSVRCVAD